MGVVAAAIVLVLAGATAIWAIVHPVVRSWRVAALLAIVSSVVLLSYATLVVPWSILLSAVVTAGAAWLVLTGRRWLLALAPADYAYSETLAAADARIQSALSRVGEEVDPRMAARMVEEALRALDDPSPDLAWEHVRKLKVEECRLALRILSGQSPEPEADIARQQTARAVARADFDRLLRAKSNFWR